MLTQRIQHSTFSSNMPGGIGGNDIWKVTINGDGTYGKPENLGPKINTEGDESFPLLMKTIYFILLWMED